MRSVYGLAGETVFLGFFFCCFFFFWGDRFVIILLTQLLRVLKETTICNVKQVNFYDLKKSCLNCMISNFLVTFRLNEIQLINFCFTLNASLDHSIKLVP